MGQHVFEQRIQRRLVEIRFNHTFSKIVENDGARTAAKAPECVSCSSAQMRELDRNVSKRTDLRL
jgi:hypothetical protein